MATKSVSSDLTQKGTVGCFFKACDREASEKLLREAYNHNKHRNGMYMLRQSNRDPNKFILSLIKDGQCYHYRAHHAGNGTFLDEKTDSIFYSLDEFLEYYQGEGARHLRCALTMPLRGQKLPTFAQRRGVTTPLHQAATEGQRDVITAILEDPSCPDIHSKNEEGNTPLHEASLLGRDDAVKALLKAGANWKFVNKLGMTSMHQAAFGNCPTIVDILVTRAQGDVDARNPFNLYTPLHCAAACNNAEVITTLLSHDAPLRPLTEDGQTPYDLAIKYNASECAEKLAAWRSKPAVSRRSTYYHGSLTAAQMRAILNYFKKNDGYFFVRQSSSVPDDFAISIIWQSTLIHVKLHRKNSNSYCFEDRLHYHDSLEHAMDYFMKVYKSVVKPLSPEAAKVAYAGDSTPSSPLKLGGMAGKFGKTLANAPMESSSFDLGMSTAGPAHPFTRGRSQHVHDKQQLQSKIEKGMSNPLVNKKVVNIREEQLTLGRLLGEGNFGQVFAGEYRDEHGAAFPVAIKALKGNMDNQARDDMKKEAFVMKELTHPCIVQELLSMGSLLDYLKKHRNMTTKSLFSLWITQIIHGMAYMERKKFVHRDLAARNILMQSHSRIKISDFGLSRRIDSDDYYVQQSDTPIPVAWYAPECLAQSKFTSKSDVWSFGITAWEIYTFGEFPYGNMPTDEVYSYIARGGRLSRPPDCSSSVFEVIRRCWEFEAKNRPSFPDLLKILAYRSEFVHAIRKFQSFSDY